MNGLKKNWLFSLLLLLGLLLPDSSVSYVIIGASPLLLFVFTKENKSLFCVDKNLLAFYFIIAVSFITSAFLSPGLELKDFFKFISFTLLFLLFPFTSTRSIPTWVLYFALLYILLSQLAFSLGIAPIVNLIDRFYPYDGGKLGYDTEFLLGGAGELDFIVNRRYGGIYRNPNQAVRYITLIFIVFLIENYKSKLVKKLPFIALVLTSVILSGSRTGILLVLLVIFYNIYVFNKTSLSLNSMIAGILLAVPLIVAYFFAADLGLRIFEVSAGVDNSLGEKFVVFGEYFNSLSSPLRFLIGHFSSESISTLYGVRMLDSEFGELFYNFGFLGVVTLALFYRKILNLRDARLRFFMLVLLWGITSTILFSFKMSFLFMLMLSKYYSQYLHRKIKGAQ